jgi:hypothetical protein
MVIQQGCPFEVTPYDESNLVKTPELVNFNYTNQDFFSLKARLEQFIKERFGDDFNDLIESDLAIMLIENWAFVADTLSYKIDQIANEIFIDTVSEIDNAFRLSALVGFKPTPPIASRALFAATLSNILETDLIIDTPLQTNIVTEVGGRTYELFPADNNNNPIFNEPIIIPAGQLINTTIVGVEGSTKTLTNTANGSINQSYQLDFGPVIYDSIRVTVDGNMWERVDFFTDSKVRQEYRVEFDSEYNAFVIFGNNKAGRIPSNGSIISITYRSGGGVVGDIVTGSIDFQRGIIVPGFEFRVPVTFRNYTRGEFGYNGDTIEDIKRKLPAFLRTQDRAVAGDDYKSLANNFITSFNGQVGKATAVLRNYGCAANIIDIYVLSKDGENGLQESTNGLKVELIAEYDQKKMFTDHICIKNGVVIEVDVQIDVVMDKFYRKFEDEFREQILRRIDTFFNLNNWDYNKDLRDRDLAKEISDIKEIDSIEINFVTENENNSGEIVVTKFFEIIRSSDIELNFVFQ